MAFPCSSRCAGSFCCPEMVELSADAARTAAPREPWVGGLQRNPVAHEDHRHRPCLPDAQQPRYAGLNPLPRGPQPSQQSLVTPQCGLPPPSTDIRHAAAYHEDYPGNHQGDQPCRRAAAARLLCWWRRGRGRRRGGSRFGRRCGGWRRRKRGSGRRRWRRRRRQRCRGSRLRRWRRCRRGCQRGRRRRRGRGSGCRCRRGRRCRGRCWRRGRRRCGGRGWRGAYSDTGSAAHRCLLSVHVLDDPGENVGTLGGGSGHGIRKGFLPQQREGDGLAVNGYLRFRQVGACVGEPGGQRLHDLPKTAVSGEDHRDLQPPAREHRRRGEGPDRPVRRRLHRSRVQQRHNPKSRPGNRQHSQHFPDQCSPFYPLPRSNPRPPSNQPAK